MTGEPGNAAALDQGRFFVSSVTLFPMGRGERARGVWETISAPVALTISAFGRRYRGVAATISAAWGGGRGGEVRKGEAVRPCLLWEG